MKKCRFENRWHPSELEALFREGNCARLTGCVGHQGYMDGAGRDHGALHPLARDHYRQLLEDPECLDKPKIRELLEKWT